MQVLGFNPRIIFTFRLQRSGRTSATESGPAAAARTARFSLKQNTDAVIKLGTNTANLQQLRALVGVHKRPGCSRRLDTGYACAGIIRGLWF